MLSFLTYKRWEAEVKGLNAFPKEDWPDNIPLLYFSYHIMVGLGTMFIAVMVVSAFLLWRKKLFDARWMLWILMLSAPFPYIANIAGWMTAEIGRQPWLVYGLMRTAEGYSKMVIAGNGWFTLLGFMGMYTVLSILFLFLVYREIEHGPVGLPALRQLNEGASGRNRELNMPTLWFLIVALMLVAYVVLDGFDLGAGVDPSVCRPNGRRARDRDTDDWSGVGRKRSVAARGRRSAVLCVSAAVRVGVQRILSAADDGAVAADAARDRHRVSHSQQQSSMERLLRHHLLGRQAFCWRSSTGQHSATWCAECR